MSTIRLEHDKFSAAPMLAELLNDRLLSVSEAGSEAAGDIKSTTYVCSKAFEASVGGEDAALARGRANTSLRPSRVKRAVRAGGKTMFCLL